MRLFIKAMVYLVIFIIVLSTFWFFLIGESITDSLLGSGKTIEIEEGKDQVGDDE